MSLQVENGWLVKYTGNEENLVIPEGVVGISSYAFDDNSVIRTVKLPESLECINDFAFHKCIMLERIINYRNNIKFGFMPISCCPSVKLN